MAIVGGGPAGCLTAANLPRSLRTLIFEEHEQTGVPTQCAGLVTERVVRSVGAEGTVLNRIDGACIHFPDGRVLRLKADATKAVVVDRRLFDERCRDLAVKAGAEYLNNHHFTGLERGTNGIAVEGGARASGTDLPIQACGRRGRLSLRCGEGVRTAGAQGIAARHPGGPGGRMGGGELSRRASRPWNGPGLLRLDHTLRGLRPGGALRSGQGREPEPLPASVLEQNETGHEKKKGHLFRGRALGPSEDASSRTECFWSAMRPAR